MDMEPNNDANAIQFPAGLRVLAVDDDINALNLIQELCNRCHYHVTPCSQARVALNLVMERKSSFDLILSDVRMPDMDGFEFLKHVTKESNVPVIMMSMHVDATTNAVMKALVNGASEFLIKPLREEEIRNIWQHVVRRDLKEEHFSSLEEYDRKRRDFEIFSSVTDEDVAADAANENGSTKETEVDESEINGYAPKSKKRRIVWSAELHTKFMNAVSQLGQQKAVPAKILELMDVPDLTRENVASHLQKFRNFLKKKDGMPNKSSKQGKYKGFEDFVASDDTPLQVLPSSHSEHFGCPNNSMQNIANSNHSHQNNITSGAAEKLGMQENNVHMNNTLQHQQQQQFQQQTLMQNLIHSTNVVQSSQTSVIGYNNVMLAQLHGFSSIAQFPVENNNQGRRFFFGSAPPIQQLQNTSFTRSSSLPIITQFPYGSSVSGQDSLYQAASVENLRYDDGKDNSYKDMILCDTLNPEPNSMYSPQDLPSSQGFPS